jgi:hypothetical protein
MLCSLECLRVDVDVVRARPSSLLISTICRCRLTNAAASGLAVSFGFDAEVEAEVEAEVMG